MDNGLILIIVGGLFALINTGAGFMIKMLFNKMRENEREIERVKEFYVSQRQLDKIMDRIHHDNSETRARLDNLFILLNDRLQ